MYTYDEEIARYCVGSTAGGTDRCCSAVHSGHDRRLRRLRGELGDIDAAGGTCDGCLTVYFRRLKH